MPLSASERQTVEWLATWPASTVENVAEIIRKCGVSRDTSPAATLPRRPADVPRTATLGELAAVLGRRRVGGAGLSLPGLHRRAGGR